MAMGLTLGSEHPRLVGTIESLPNLFDVLQVRPLLGRTFVPEDGVKGHDNVAILTYPFWQSLFDGNADVIGRTIRVDDIAREIVGVLPRGFRIVNAEADLIFPLAFDRGRITLGLSAGAGGFNYQGVARLRRGITIAEANADVARMVPIWMAPGQMDRAQIHEPMRPGKSHPPFVLSNKKWSAA